MPEQYRELDLPEHIGSDQSENSTSCNAPRQQRPHTLTTQQTATQHHLFSTSDDLTCNGQLSLPSACSSGTDRFKVHREVANRPITGSSQRFKYLQAFTSLTLASHHVSSKVLALCPARNTITRRSGLKAQLPCVPASACMLSGSKSFSTCCSRSRMRLTMPV